MTLTPILKIWYIFSVSVTNDSSVFHINWTDQVQNTASTTTPIPPSTLVTHLNPILGVLLGRSDGVLWLLVKGLKKRYKFKYVYAYIIRKWVNLRTLWENYLASHEKKKDIFCRRRKVYEIHYSTMKRRVSL